MKNADRYCNSRFFRWKGVRVTRAHGDIRSCDEQSMIPTIKQSINTIILAGVMVLSGCEATGKNDSVLTKPIGDERVEIQGIRIPII